MEAPRTAGVHTQDPVCGPRRQSGREQPPDPQVGVPGGQHAGDGGAGLTEGNGGEVDANQTSGCPSGDLDAVASATVAVEGAGEGADVAEPDDVPVGVVSDQPFELVGRADQLSPGALGLLVGLGEPVEGGVQLPPAVVVAGLERTHEPAAKRLCCIRRGQPAD